MSDRRWLNRGAVYTRERGGAVPSLLDCLLCRLTAGHTEA